MNITVLDMEMCQPSNKIIEISSVAINLKTGVVSSKFDELCNPGELPSKEITDLTGITQEQIQEALPLQEVAENFWKWMETNGTGGRLWSWGNDGVVLMMQTKQDVFPKKLHTFNFKDMVTVFRSASGGKVKGGLVNALNEFGLGFEGVPHRAYDDAYNMARLAAELYGHMAKFYQIQKVLG